MKIGSVTMQNEVFLAPMAGVTDAAFRRICREFGCGLVYSEMVSAKALTYGDKKSFKLLETDEAEKPIAVQLFGSDAEVLAQAAPLAVQRSGACILDINMGCPVPKVADHGEGAALMRDPDKIYRIVHAVCQTSPVAVTVKLRKGWDDAHVNAVEAALAAQEGGAQAVTIHGRTRSQYYYGEADWSIIEAVKQALCIPVIGNGDIFCAQDALDMKTQTGCDAVMVARGAQGNPFLFRQICELFSTGTVTYVPSLSEKLDTLLRQVSIMVEKKGEHVALREARKHAGWYLKGERNAARFRHVLNQIQTYDELKNILQSVAQCGKIDK